MNLKDLREEIAIEIELLESVIKEISSLRHDLTEREPTVREKTAAGAFMAQFYGGIENILKRISFFHSVPMPSGDNWHTDLFRRFCQPLYKTMVQGVGANGRRMLPGLGGKGQSASTGLYSLSNHR